MVMVSCCPKQVIVPQSKIDCPEPLKPNIRILDATKTDKENMKLVLENLNDMIEHSLKQEETIKCFNKSNK